MTDPRLDKIGPGACNPESHASSLVREEYTPVYFADGKEIRRWRENLQIGLREMAERLGVSATYLSRIETAKNEVKIGDDFAIRILFLETKL